MLKNYLILEIVIKSHRFTHLPIQPSNLRRTNLWCFFSFTKNNYLPKLLFQVWVQVIASWCCFYFRHLSRPEASSCVFTCVLQVSKLAYLTDAADPAVHLLLSVGRQVENARRGLHHKQVLPIEVSLYSELPIQHFHLTLFQVDGADGLFGVLTLVVLQHIGVTAHASSPQHKPSSPPCLQDKGTHSYSNCWLPPN